MTSWRAGRKAHRRCARSGLARLRAVHLRRDRPRSRARCRSFPASSRRPRHCHGACARPPSCSRGRDRWARSPRSPERACAGSRSEPPGHRRCGARQGRSTGPGRASRPGRARRRSSASLDRGQPSGSQTPRTPPRSSRGPTARPRAARGGTPHRPHLSVSPRRHGSVGLPARVRSRAALARGDCASADRSRTRPRAPGPRPRCPPPHVLGRRVHRGRPGDRGRTRSRSRRKPCRSSVRASRRSCPQRTCSPGWATDARLTACLAWERSPACAAKANPIAISTRTIQTVRMAMRMIIGVIECNGSGYMSIECQPRPPCEFRS
jgi:hypothetical protein